MECALGKVTEFDRKVLRAVNGEEVEGLRWGAAMSVTIEWLTNMGFTKRIIKGGAVTYVLTERGIAELKK